MKALIVGYGSMGKEIEKILISRGHTVSAIVDPAGSGENRDITAELLKNADVAIDFTIPAAVEKNCAIYTQNKTPVVMGTTGWENIREKVKADVEKCGIGFIWGSNFSIGANVFMHIIAKATALVNHFPEYDILLHEYHHKRKKDSPSGTALTVADIIVENSDIKSKIVTEKLDRQIQEGELHVSSTRGGEIPGTHTVIYDSLADTIELTHRVRNRSGLALGAVVAAEWVIGKTGFISVDSFFNQLLNQEKI